MAPVSVYPRHTMWPLTAFFRSSSFAKRLPVRFSFTFGNRKNSDDARSGVYGGCSKMSQWNCSRSKACVCRTVFEHALSCNRTIPRESLSLRQDNLKSHRPVENEQHLAPHSRRDSQLVQPSPQLSLHLPRDKVRRTTAWGNFKYHTEHQKPMIGYNKTGARTVCAKGLHFLNGPRGFLPPHHDVIRGHYYLYL